jgi:disulfide bond formation protein DsbB
MSAVLQYSPTERVNSVTLSAAAIAALGAATLAAAWAFQIWGGYIPCPLCLQQRIPYYVGVPLALIIAVASTRWQVRTLARLGLAGIGLIFVWSAYLAGYHSGAEWQWWPGPTGCAVDAGRVTDAGGLLDQLRTYTPVRCDEAPWRFLGLSFAGWNFVISIALAGTAFAGALRRPG